MWGYYLEEDLTKTQPCWHLISDLQLPELWEIKLCAYKSLSLRYFVMAVSTDQDSTGSKSGQSEPIRLSWMFREAKFFFLVDMNEEAARGDVYSHLWQKRRACLTIRVNVKEWEEKPDFGHVIESWFKPCLNHFVTKQTDSPFQL